MHFPEQVYHQLLPVVHESVLLLANNFDEPKGANSIITHNRKCVESIRLHKENKKFRKGILGNKAYREPV